MANKFRASFTVLDKWAGGDWEGAIKAYFKLEKFTTPAMADGHMYHEQWAKEIGDTHHLPQVFGGQPLWLPKTEQKLVVELEDWLDLVGIIDCYDTPVIYEFKTGKKNSECYAATKQCGVYSVLATFSDLKTDRAIIWHYDQYAKKADMSQVWLTDELLQDAHEWIITHASEMHNYLNENKLYERFQS